MKNTKRDVEVKDPAGGKYILRLFVIDNQPNSARAVINIKTICDKHLKGKCELDIIDLSQQPALALSEDIIAVPILIKKFPLPEIRLIGDLSDTESVLEGLSFFN
jgi:circadian clock protein KaiB